MPDKYKTITITKTVPVTDQESLIAWLNEEMADCLNTKRDMGRAKATLGTKAVELILEAGFSIKSPLVTR